MQAEGKIIARKSNFKNNLEKCKEITDAIKDGNASKIVWIDISNN